MHSKFIVVVLLFMLLSPETRAVHFMGGEITWECLPNGNYRFIVRLYRECYGGWDYTKTLSISSNVPGLGAFTVSLYPNTAQGIKDISPVCNNNPTFPHISCNDSLPHAGTGAIDEWTYTTDEKFPDGVNLPDAQIPATGWVFSCGNCCRAVCSNYNTTYHFWLRAVMYPFPSRSPDYCWDNSPAFAEKPITVICSGYPFTYNPNGYDNELDSLVYSWTPPLSDSAVPLAGLNPGYSYNSPLPGTMQNPLNVPATVNPSTGEVSFTSFTNGSFITAYKVAAYKCGIKISEIFREMEVVLLNCPTASPSLPPNTPPQVDIPFGVPIIGVQSSYIDTVFAGSVVDFILTATDNDSLNMDTISGNFGPQTVSVQASGLQFGGNNFTDSTSGCLHPPCATLNPPPPASQPIITSTHFVWQTSCNHIATYDSCGGIHNSYNFILKVRDDYCPAPAYSWKTITVVVKNPIMEPPDLNCIQVHENGQITIQWRLPDTTVIPNSWSAYYIYRASSASGPFALIDSIVYNPGGNILFHNTTSYEDASIDGQAMPYFYYIRTKSGCYGRYFSRRSNILQSIDLHSSTLSGSLKHFWWNSPGFAPNTGSGGNYILFQETGPGSWIPIDTTGLLTTDQVIFGCGNNRFMVGFRDSSGCISLSSIDTGWISATPPPVLHCTSVEQDGSVTVSYQDPWNATTLDFFSAFMVYCAHNINGPYSLVDSISDPGLNSWNVQQVNASHEVLYFYFVRRMNCQSFIYSATSDTISTILLSITGLSPSIAQLEWNELQLHPPAGDTIHYQIYRMSPGNNWAFIDSTIQHSILDSLLLCRDSVPYRIKIQDRPVCEYASNIAKSLFFNDVLPPAPKIDSVSVDSLTGNSILGWKPLNTGIIGYIIFNENNGVWQALDTVWDASQTTYTDFKSPQSSCETVNRYSIASIDTCMNVSTIATENIHNTLLLSLVYQSPCKPEITLSWNPYINMGSLAGYYIYYRYNWGPSVILDTLIAPAPGLAPPSLYVHKNYAENSWYCYSIRAFNASGTITSSSCQVCKYSDKPKKPEYNHLKLVTVENNSYTRLKIAIDVDANIAEYKVMRATTRNGPYEVVGLIPQQTDPEIIYYDYEARPEMESYFYFIELVDSCGVVAMHSDTSRTLFVSVKSNIDFTNLVKWNDYEGWSWSSVDAYKVFRGIDGMLDPIPIATLPYGTTEYLDDVSGYIETQGKFTYFIEATERDGGLLPYVDTSNSNTVNNYQSSLVYIPNAFSPRGHNTIFKPVSSFVDYSGYLFQIYNRWGEMIFETNDPNAGWDGTFKGEFVPMGSYIYYVKCKTSEGQIFERRSTVTVIK